MSELLSDDEVDRQLGELHPDWSRDGNAIRRSVEAESFAAGIALVDEVARVADERNHHPDIDIRWTTITFTLSTHSAGGLTAQDFDLAATIDFIARR